MNITSLFMIIMLIMSTAYIWGCGLLLGILAIYGGMIACWVEYSITPTWSSEVCEVKGCEVFHRDSSTCYSCPPNAFANISLTYENQSLINIFSIPSGYTCEMVLATRWIVANTTITCYHSNQGATQILIPDDTSETIASLQMWAIVLTVFAGLVTISTIITVIICWCPRSLPSDHPMSPGSWRQKL